VLIASLFIEWLGRCLAVVAGFGSFACAPVALRCPSFALRSKVRVRPLCLCASVQQSRAVSRGLIARRVLPPGFRYSVHWKAVGSDDWKPGCRVPRHWCFPKPPVFRWTPSISKQTGNGCFSASSIWNSASFFALVRELIRNYIGATGPRQTKNEIEMARE